MKKNIHSLKSKITIDFYSKAIIKRGKTWNVCNKKKHQTSNKKAAEVTADLKIGKTKYHLGNRKHFYLFRLKLVI